MKTNAKTRKPKPKTAEQLLVDKILGDVQRIRKEKGIAPEAAQVEGELDKQAAELFELTSGRNNGTTLDAATALGRIEREGGPAHDRIGSWTPPMAIDPASLAPLAADIAAAKARVEADRQKRMTAAERELYALEQQQAKILADEKAQAAHVARMAEPKVKAALDKLKALDERTAKDASWDWTETVAIARAILAIETLGSDLEAALKLADDAFGIERQKKTDAMSAHEKEVARLKAEIALLGDKPTEQQQTETKSDPPAQQQQTDPPASDWYTLRQAYDKLRVDPNATHAAVSAANNAWYHALCEANKTAAQSADAGATTETKAE